MIKQTEQFIVINKAGNKILAKDAIRFEEIEKVFKNSTKAWHFRSYLYDSEKDCKDTFEWIEHYAKTPLNFSRKEQCKEMLEEGFIIKKATVVFNFAL